VRLLIDTNIFLEIILEQERALEARDLLSRIGQYDFFISDFSLHSIGLLLFRLNRHEIFRRFLNDMLINAAMSIITLASPEIESVVEPALKFNLDFDDAYQYAIAERYDLAIVSFDADFDRTARGRYAPNQIHP